MMQYIVKINQGRHFQLFIWLNRHQKDKSHLLPGKDWKRTYEAEKKNPGKGLDVREHDAGRDTSDYLGLEGSSKREDRKASTTPQRV